MLALTDTSPGSVAQMRALAIARVALGIVLVVRTTALANLMAMPLAHVRGPLFGWPELGVQFAWGGVVLPDGMKIGAAIARTIAAILFLTGVRPRITGVACGALGFVALSQDPFGFVFTLYVLFLGTIVLALADVRLLRIVLASVYGWSAIAKISREWLSGRTLQALAEDGLATPWMRHLLVEHELLRIAAAWSVLVAELALAFAIVSLVFRERARRAVLVVALLFHLVLEIATRPDVMSFVMASLIVGATWHRQGAPALKGAA